ncbi:MAG: putative sulfate exporter family transporter [Pseudomonadota bacterium]
MADKLKFINSAHARSLLPGLFVAGIVALAARFVSDHYGAPAMLMALLFGIALHFLTEHPTCGAGISFASKTVLRVGVALLGVRISADMAVGLGWPVLLLVVSGVIATIAFGMLFARFFGFRARFAFLSAGSVAICGASAAMAISAILPKDDRSEERLVFTVVGVTVLSTAAMILYPAFAEVLRLSDREAGIFLGATIHDVAQVVGAGFSVSDQTGEVATIVKLLRVAMLAPIIFIAALVIRRLPVDENASGERPPLVPIFVAIFFVLVGINSLGLIPSGIQDAAAGVSSWALLTAIAAVGIKTSLKDVVDVGGAAIALLVAQTLFIGGLVVSILVWTGISA